MRNDKRPEPLLRRLFILAVPLVLQNLVIVSVGLADSMMVGSHLGEYALAGISIANQVMMILHMLVMGISAVLVILAAQYWGKRDIKSIKEIIAIAVKVCFALGGVINLAVFITPYGVLRIFSDNPEAIAQGVVYIRIVSFSYLFFCATHVLMASMRCVEIVRIGLWVSISTLIIAVGLNYLLIFGNHGFPEMGIRGAAIATLAARVVEAVIMVIYVRFIDKRLRLRFGELLGFNRLLFKDFVRYGSPVLGGDLLWGLALTMQVAIMGRMGSAAMASQSVTIVLSNFTMVIVWGCSAAAAIIIGKTVGEERYDLVKRYARALQVTFAVLGLATAGVYFGLRDFFLSFYDFAPETMAMARQFMAITALYIPLTSYHAPCFTGIIRAGGDTKFVLKVDGICAWLIVLPSAFLAAFVFGASPVVVYFFLRIDQFFKWVIAIIKTNRFKWIINLTR
ncbi:MAG: MATE family efflux transporter [Defluviitaleaceae bacterium]|nr:MATE family efflux transporter [Defluviitaleaceae bacterium]